MIDIHSHLLYGIDDGSDCIENSIEIINDLSLIGYTDIILTPHYISESRYSSPKGDNIKLLQKLQKGLDYYKIDVKLYLGNEIYINDDISYLLDSGEISSLNGSKYLLIELPMNGEYSNYLDIFEDLISLGYKVILAHPERYISFQNDFEKIYDVLDVGVELQCNIESILGSYGSSAIKTVKRIYKEKLVSYLATDIHHKKSDYGKYARAIKKIRKYLSDKELDEVLNVNPSKILN